MTRRASSVSDSKGMLFNTNKHTTLPITYLTLTLKYETNTASATWDTPCTACTWTAQAHKTKKSIAPSMQHNQTRFK